MFSLFFLLPFACQKVEFFHLAGYEQESFSNDADILFVIDNSSSMKEEAQSLGNNFNIFINIFASSEGATESTRSLSDAVDNFTSYVNDRGRYIDYNLGITTTSVDFSAGATTDEIDVGEAGLLVNGPIGKYDGNVEKKFKEGLFCNATFWIESELPSNPSYNCGEDTDEVTVEYLDCLCGDNWGGISGSGNEEPIEAAYLALCRATENPPDSCSDAISPFNDADPLANIGFLREEATTVVVMIGDEADNSRRMQQGQSDPETYIDLFAEFEQKIKFAAIGPNWDGDSLLCNSGGATTWAVERVQTLALSSGGFYEPLEFSPTGNGDDCELVDFSIHLEKLGELLNTLETDFKLAQKPLSESIRTYVNGDEVIKSPLVCDGGDYLNAKDVDSANSGWCYSSAKNSVSFLGEAIPDYNSQVEIFYLPDDAARELPFTY
jgi:hypothetical protein